MERARVEVELERNSSNHGIDERHQRRGDQGFQAGSPAPAQPHPIFVLPCQRVTGRVAYWFAGSGEPKQSCRGGVLCSPPPAEVCAFLLDLPMRG